MNKICVVFDLDDTLYKEKEFVRSAFREICNIYSSNNDTADFLFDKMMYAFDNNGNAFTTLLNLIPSETLSVEGLLTLYREHKPKLSLNADTKTILTILRENKVEIGLITDGRTVSQRNKIEALGLTKYIREENIVISEEFGSCKPDKLNFLHFMEKYPDCQTFIYVGDNLEKDFITPNTLGWKSICLADNGENIHKQNFNIRTEYLPKYIVNSLKEILFILSLRE